MGYPTLPYGTVSGAYTGAVSASLYVGATASGAPVSGTFAVGNWVVAQNGNIWICVAAGSPGTWVNGAPQSREQLRNTGRGIISEPFGPSNLDGAVFAPTSQTIYAALIGLRRGDLVGNIVVNIGVAGIGTVPTGMYVGLYNAALGLVASSANLNASAIWTAATGMVAAPLSATYTVTADGAFYAVFLKDGAFAGTDISLTRASPNGVAGKPLGANLAPYATMAAQATLPVTLVPAAGTSAWAYIAAAA